MIIEAFLIDVLTFDESFKPNIKVLACGDTLFFEESMGSNLPSPTMTDEVIFAESMSVAKVYNRAMTDTITFSEVMLPRVLVVSFGDVLGFSEVMQVEDIPYMTDRLDFTESWDISVAKPLKDDLVFTEVMEYSQTRNFPMADSLNILEYMTVTLAHCPCPTVAEQPHQVTFAVGSDAVVLPMPKFGNSNTVLFRRLNRVTRGNELIVAGVPGWNPDRLQRYEWDYLTQAQADAIFNFMKRYHGIPVTVTGVYSEIKTVILLKPDAELSQIGRDNRTLILDMQIVD